MGRKKKRKSGVNINAIDKYLMQKKYTRDFQENKTATEKPKLLNVVLRRVNINDKSVNRKILSRKCREKSDEPVTKKPKIEETRKYQTVSDPSVRICKTKENEKSIKVTEKKSRRQKASSETLKKKSILVQRKQGPKKVELINKKTDKLRKLNKKPIKKASEKVTNMDTNVRTVRWKSHEEDKMSDVDIEPEKSEKSVEVLIKKRLVSDEMGLLQKPEILDSDIEGTRVKSTGEQDPESSQFVISSCFCHTSDLTKEAVEERNPLTKKYQPYMERIKLLTSESIKQYIFDNQQYYIDLQNQVESNIKNFEKISKKRKEDFKDMFKCNPFNSAQQITMFNTLREIFKIPQAQFKECRNFFTVLIPEISCQLFAETFHIKVSFAPRLIKKLYPKPVCPV